MSSQISNVVVQKLETFRPSVACGAGCKVMWADGVPCEHGISVSRQCSERCRKYLQDGKLCIHAQVFCSLCSESQWPVHACYCFRNEIDPKVV